MAMTSPLNVRRAVLTGAVISVTIAGTLYGAGLKTEREVAQSSQKRQEVTIDERLKSLQSMRENLNSKKLMVEKQLQDLDKRIEEKRERGIGDVNKS